jgi:hypothetical protein
MKRTGFATIAVLIIFLAVWARPGLGAAVPPNLELYVSPDRTFALYRPTGWQVSTQEYQNGRMVAVTAPKGADFAQMVFLKSTDNSNNSVKFASLTLKNVRAQKPGLKVIWARSTQKRDRTVVEFEYEQSDKTLIRGRQYFIMSYPKARVFGYETEAARFDKMQPVLLSVLSNFTHLDPTQWKGTEKQGSAPAPVNLPMTTRALPDGSASLLVPSGWGLTGAKGTALSKSPDNGAGLAFSTADFYGPSNMPYFDSSKIPGVLHYPYMAPMDAMMIIMQKYGSSRIQVVERNRDPARAAGAAAFLKRKSDVEAAILTFNNENGVRCKGYYDVISFQPMASGQWGILFYAVWAPEAQFDGYLPSLLKMWESYRINEQWASDYIKKGMENLKRMAAKTSQMMADTAKAARESSTAAFQERMRSQDYLDHKRTNVIRGEQDWVSQVEGGAIYKSDHWGLSREGERLIEGQPYNYYNFDGRNPRYNETLTPVDASREVYESVYGKGR